MNKILLILFLFSLSSVVACSGDGKTTSTVSETIPAANVEIKDSKSAEVYKHYIRLKDALVSSDVTEAGKAGTDLANALTSVQGCENSSAIAHEIAQNSDIKIQREKFTLLSAEIIPLMKHADLSSGSIYVQYCPMANDGSGGYWLASEKKIRNPYYGDEMPECGEVKEEIKVGNK